MSKKDDVAYSLQTLCHPASEFLADGQRLTLFIKRGNEAASEILRLRAENEKLRAERDLWISRFEDFRKNAARLEEARSRPMRLVGSAAAALKETGDE